MKLLRARIQGGHIVPDDASELTEGSIVNVAVLDDDTQVDESDRAAIDAVISAGHASIQRGEGIPAEQVLNELDALS